MAHGIGLQKSCYNGDYNKKQRCKSEQIYKNLLSSKYSLKLENILEAEIASNRVSSRHGEYLPKLWTHRLSRPG